MAEKIVLDSAIKFGAGRYRQGMDILEQCGEEIARFGKHVMIVAGPRAWAAAKDRLLPSIQAAGLTYVVELYEGTCCYENALLYSAKCNAAGCDEVVGVGGGKIMDFSKAVAEYAGVGTVNIPTSMSTCAPFTCMSVMYTLEGAKKDCWRYSHELDAVLVDTKILSECPIRYNAAGILDAMAKKIEIMNGKPALYLEDTKIDLFSAFSMAQYTYEALEKFGPVAIEDNRQHKVTKALEDVAFLNIPITGTIANITQSFSQSAIAHSFYDAVITYFPLESKGALHGEIVAVGLFIQLYYNRLPGDEAALRDFMKGMDMPLSLDECGVPSTDENLAKLEAYLIDSPYVAKTEDSYRILHEAMERVRA